MRVITLCLLSAIAVSAKIRFRQASPSMVKQHLAVPTSNAAMAEGKSFVYAYINSHLSPTDTTYTENLFLTITNAQSTNAVVTITSQYKYFTNQTVTVAAGVSFIAQITPADMQVDYMDKQEGQAFFDLKSIWVSSTVPVSLVATNQLSDFSSEDKFAILPICQLGTQYKVIVDETSDSNTLQATNVVTIIATEDNTVVSLRPVVAGNHTLLKGEMLSMAVAFRASGADVVADKPVAVISGAVCGFGYGQDNIHCSHEALMLYPLASVGTTFPAFKFQPNDLGELLMFILENNTNVKVDDDKLEALNTDMFWIIRLQTGAYVTSDKPVYIGYAGSANIADQGAPFLVHVPSTNLFTPGPVPFGIALTTDEAENMVHFARIETHLNFIGQILIDDYAPNGLIYRRMGASEYYFVDVQIQRGEHFVRTFNPDATFAVTAYGFGERRSYGFNPGLNLPTNGQC